jgi:hypothetical protein
MEPKNGVTVRVVEGGWLAPTQDVHAVADSAVAAFQDVLAGTGIIKIALEPGEEHYPWTLDMKNSIGEFVVRLDCQGCRWAQMAYQFSHEFCHVLANPTSMQRDEFFWIEEVLCETASIFALRSMASKWVTTPPYPNWAVYSENLCAYARERIAIGCKILSPSADISAWLAGRLPDLKKNPQLREDNTAVAVRLLPIFEQEPSAWAVVFHLHAFRRDPMLDLANFMKTWSQSCPTVSSKFVLQIAEALGISDGQ